MRTSRFGVSRLEMVDAHIWMIQVLQCAICNAKVIPMAYVISKPVANHNLAAHVHGCDPFSSQIIRRTSGLFMLCLQHLLGYPLLSGHKRSIV